MSTSITPLKPTTMLPKSPEIGKSNHLPKLSNKQFWLKLGVIATYTAIFLVAWLSFWLFSSTAIELKDFLLSPLQTQSQSYWQFSRIAGVLAYSAMWLSVMTGLSINSQTSSYWYARGTVVSWHRFFTWLAIVLAVVHATVLLKDGYIAATFAQLFVPFQFHSPNLTGWAWLWIGLGQIAGYFFLIIAVTSHVKQKIAKSVWKYLHSLVLLAYVGTVLHGLFLGTDSKQIWLQGFYLMTNVIFLVMVFFRLIQMKRQ